MNIPRRPFVKPRETVFSKAQNSLTSSKIKQSQHKSEKPGSLSPPYVVNAQIQSQRKSKARGQHKNGKSANKPTPKPTVQTLRGLTVARGPNIAGEVRLITSRPRGRSTPSPVTTTVTQTSPPTTVPTTKVASRQRIVDVATASSLQRGLILLEPPAKPAINNVPAIFQQYPKIQQLYPLYPVYAGVRGAGQQHATRAKGLELLQDEQFDSKNLDKDTLDEFKLVFYGTETSLEFDDELDKDKPLPPVNQQDVSQDNTAIGARHNVMDTEGGPWTGSQQVERVSHPEVQRPTTENQTSGCSGVNTGNGRCLGGCLILLLLAYLLGGASQGNLATSWQNFISVGNESGLETVSCQRMACLDASLPVDRSSRQTVSCS
ncbi:furin protease [Apis cerana cerana]|uniref:Furin protease n=1 Tax=Apis cerana cerana TaxID=94128 RepID=A0A2A3EME9_APICC|nr:furin protease [Apis cerana cerana]